jgi:hypothetical protein
MIMNYPSQMTIVGQTVPVSIIDTPLYTFATCPTCKDPSTNEPYTFIVDYGAEAVCPACGCTHCQPRENSYVFGQFDVLQNKITNWHSDAYSDVCGTSFVHETIEAINSINDIKLNHTQITTLAANIYQAFSSGGVAFSSEKVTYH